MALNLTKEMARSATGASDALAAKFLPYFNSVLPKYDINTPERVLAFLSQVGHESGGLRYTEEIASGQAYEGRKDLGNIQPGDGKRFKGRGIIQITGRYNYEKVSNALNKDFVSNPSMLSEPKYAVEASAWWWKNRGLNEVSDKMSVKKPLSDPDNNEFFKRITYLINGGYNGLQDRIGRWQAGQSSVAEWVKKNPIITTIGIAASVLLVITIIYYSANKEQITLAA